MKYWIFIFINLYCATLCYSQTPFANPNQIVDTFKKSIPCLTKGFIFNAAVEIRYYSPAVRSRIIWGGLVPYDQVWVTGAHNATQIEFSKNAVLNGILIKAGTYALFTIPGKEEWIVIINKNYKQHLTDQYKQEEDIVRLKVKPSYNKTSKERLEYVVQNNTIVIAWEKVQLTVPFQNNHY